MHLSCFIPPSPTVCSATKSLLLSRIQQAQTENPTSWQRCNYFQWQQKSGDVPTSTVRQDTVTVHGGKVTSLFLLCICVCFAVQLHAIITQLNEIITQLNAILQFRAILFLHILMQPCTQCNITQLTQLNAIISSGSNTGLVNIRNPPPNTAATAHIFYMW